MVNRLLITTFAALPIFTIYKMKKIITAAVIFAASAQAFAEGYQVNTLSARQNGMGHTGTALKLGAESQIFNPGALGFLDANLEFKGSVTGIFATATATQGDNVYKTNNTASTPMSFNLGMSVYDNVKVGVSFYTPYGSGIRWGEEWPGAVLNESVTLKSFTVQPTVAWRILPNLSVGAGAMITWGTVNLDKGLVPASSFNYLLSQMNIPAAYACPPASINLNGKSSVTAGINVGVLWDITDQWSVGFSFRQMMKLNVKCGTASLSYADDVAQQILQQTLGVLNQSDFSASMPAPAVYNIGVSYKPLNKLTLAFDAQLTGWKTYKSLDIEFLNPQLSGFNQHLPKNYRNSWTFHLGAEYNLTERFDVRAGLMVDTTPVNMSHYNPETPGATKIEPAVGFSFSPIKNFSIDASLLYVAGLKRDNASCSYTDVLTGQDNVFTADYKVHAVNPAIGVTFSF